MNTSMIRLLLIEDNPADALLVREMLDAAQHIGWHWPRCELKHVVRLQEGLDCLENETFDVILSDLDLPDSRAGETVATLREHAPQMPLVVLTGREDEDLARESVRAGAQDYLYKDEATNSLLIRAVLYAIERQQTRDVLAQRVEERTAKLQQVNAALGTSEQRYRTLFEAALNPIMLMDENGRYIDANKAALDFLECEPEELLGKRVWDFTPPVVLGQQQQAPAPFLTSRTLETEYLVQGAIKTLLLNVVPLEIEDQMILYGIGQDITERKVAEEALRESETRYRSLFQDYPISIWEEDFSKVKAYLDDLRASGVTDFTTYFKEHPDAVTHCVDLVRIIAANEAALALRGAESQDDFSQGLNGFLSEGALVGFAEELVQIAGGATRIEIDVVDRTPQGELRHLAVTWQVAPGYEETLSRCLVSTRDITERKETEQALQASELRARQKLVSVLSPDCDLSGLGLADIIDVEAIQALMDDFYTLTDIGVAIVDLAGEVLIATGWQDICTKFHRTHPDTCRHCIESDIELSSGIEPGTYQLYKCKNHMWDMATPIVIGGRHMGNLFVGQFFFADERVDRELFRRQAQQYGFDEKAYLAALERVPRWTRERVDTVFKFYVQFAEMISELSYSNLQLARTLAEKERLLEVHKKSEEKFKSYIEHAPYGVFVADEEGRYLDVNEAACRLTGYPRDELLNMSIIQLAAPERQTTAREHFKTVVERGFVTGVEPFIRKDGSLRWWSVTAVRLSEMRFLGYAEDVTERKRAEEAVQKSAAKMRSIFRAAPTGIGLVSDRQLLEVNDRLCELIGYSRDELVGCDARLLYPADDDYEYVGREKYRQIREQGTGTVETRFQHKDGSILNVLLSSTPLDLSDLSAGVTFTALDITERKRAEEALRESEARYRYIFRTAGVPIWEEDFSAVKAAIDALEVEDFRQYVEAHREFVIAAQQLIKIRDINPATLKMLKARSKEEVKNALDKVFVPETQQILKEELIALAEGKTYFEGETINRTLQGERRNILLTMAIPPDPEKLDSVLISTMDITERKEAEQKIAQYAADLRRSNRELQQFAYVVSHDLKAPLRTLKAYLHLLVENCDQHLDERADTYVHHVLESAQRMQDMIGALLNLSRVETQSESFAPTDCNLLVQQVVEDLQSPIEAAGTEVSCDPLPTVLADRAQLARVFHNLVANAIKFHRTDASPHVHISAAREENVWTFAVRDNGIGIDPTQAERIFQIFQRLHTQAEYPGLGIGLALCKRIVERHGGRIWLESEPGTGSTFYFTIPTERRPHE